MNWESLITGLRLRSRSLSEISSILMIVCSVNKCDLVLLSLLPFLTLSFSLNYSEFSPFHQQLKHYKCSLPRQKRLIQLFGGLQIYLVFVILVLEHKGTVRQHLLSPGTMIREALQGNIKSFFKTFTSESFAMKVHRHLEFCEFARVNARFRFTTIYVSYQPQILTDMAESKWNG